MLGYHAEKNLASLKNQTRNLPTRLQSCLGVLPSCHHLCSCSSWPSTGSQYSGGPCSGCSQLKWPRPDLSQSLYILYCSHATTSLTAFQKLLTRECWLTFKLHRPLLYPILLPNMNRIIFFWTWRSPWCCSCSNWASCRSLGSWGWWCTPMGSRSPRSKKIELKITKPSRL